MPGVPRSPLHDTERVDMSAMNRSSSNKGALRMRGFTPSPIESRGVKPMETDSSADAGTGMAQPVESGGAALGSQGETTNQLIARGQGYDRGQGLMLGSR